MLRALFLLVCLTLLTVGNTQVASAQSAEMPPKTRAETGGATTLEDILRRQRGEDVDMEFRRDALGDAEGGAATTDQLGTLGGASDPELWRALRFGEADITSQVRSPGATLLVQDDGMAWLQFRDGPLQVWGGFALLGMLGLLLLFFLLRGRIQIEAGRSGITIQRFAFIERFAHWLFAGSFILLGLTGLITLFGRNALELFAGQPETYASLRDIYANVAVASKWVHNNVAWAFILGLIMIFVLWVIHNIPSRTDINWMLKGGGLFSKHSHPPAKKFNAGQKIIFWSCVVFGGSIAASGIALLFPFEFPMFQATFDKMRSVGITALPVYGPLPETLTPHAEMMHAQAWHAIMSFLLMVIVVAHIYIGSVGMEGAYDAMGSGEVDVNWAKEHHSLWVEEVEAKSKGAPGRDATPAE
ncbi:MAG: formate dehydrogenase subunit gamma [Paracoccaceae bacterium]